MNNNSSHHLAAIILAAGKGKRMQSIDKNKVTSPLAGKPMIMHIVEFMQKISVEQIIVVVGHAKESVKAALEGVDVTYAEQKEQLGTGDAAKIALDVLSPQITDVLVVYGDDAVLYNKNNTDIIANMITEHYLDENALTFLTIEQENPFGLGRIVRDGQGNVQGIVEEKNTTDDEKKIAEVNPGCFVFSVDFLEKFVRSIKQNEVSGEYYLTDLVDIARSNNLKMSAVRGGKLLWRGVNTPEELATAESLIGQRI